MKEGTALADTFSRRQVERSFRKFSDIVNDLIKATFQTWGNTFTHLMTHCEQDPVMQVVTQPLRENPGVHVEDWYAEAMGTVGGMVGSAHYELPYDDDDRTALLYQFFLLAENGKADFKSFCMFMYGSTKPQEMIYHLNQELVQKFTREVAYRLAEILEDLGDEQEVSRQAMVVFHHHDQSMNNHANVQGSHIAPGWSSIADASGTFTNNSDLADALKALKALVKEVREGKRQAVEDALSVLVQAATDPTVTPDAVKNAASVVVAGSPMLKDRLYDMWGRISIGPASSAISRGLELLLGVR
jgi:hypothetical protein